MTKIIAIAGKMGAGKTTLAQGLIHKINHANSEFRSLPEPRLASLASPIKLIAWRYLGVDFTSQKDKSSIPTPFPDISGRRLLQGIGGKMREIHPDFWINTWEYRNPKDPSKVYIVDDLRFDNELQFFRRKNALTIFLGRNPKGRESDDPSEEGVSQLLFHDFDRTFLLNEDIHDTLEKSWELVFKYLSGTYPQEIKLK